MDAFIPPLRVECGVLQASFGKVITPEELSGFHNSWNTLRHSLGLAPCRFKPEWTHSGCRLPLCPQCGVRARKNVCMAVLSWHHAHPAAPLSILNYTVTSPEVTDFNLVFESKTVRQLSGRKREQTKSAAFITLCGYIPQKQGTPHWVHRRMSILVHGPSAKLSHRHGPAIAFDDVATIGLEHAHLPDLRGDNRMGTDWANEHPGGLIVGGLLRRMPRISTLFRKEAPSAESLLRELDSGDYRYYRTQKVSEQ